MTQPAPIAFDTLEAFEELQEAGLDPEVARILVETIARAHINRSVTRADLQKTEYRLDLRLREVDSKLELQEARNRVGISAVRKEGAGIRDDIARGLTRLTRTVIVLFCLLAVLVVVRDRYAAEIPLQIIDTIRP